MIWIEKSAQGHNTGRKGNKSMGAFSGGRLRLYMSQNMIDTDERLYELTALFQRQTGEQTVKLLRAGFILLADKLVALGSQLDQHTGAVFPVIDSGHMTGLNQRRHSTGGLLLGTVNGFRQMGHSELSADRAGQQDQPLCSGKLADLPWGVQLSLIHI